MRVLITGSSGMMRLDGVAYFESKYRPYSWATRSRAAALTINKGRHAILCARAAKR